MTAFSIPLAQLAEKAKLDLETVARKATADLFRAVVLRSPVDTGRFRANWNVSYGQPDLTTTAEVDTHAKRLKDGGIKVDFSKQVANKGRGLQEAAKPLGLPVGGIVFLSNGLPYAKRLEYDSWSKQAPAGMIRISAAEFDTYVREAVAK